MMTIEVPRDPQLLKVLNEARNRFGLKSIEEVVANNNNNNKMVYPNILIQQKEVRNEHWRGVGC